MVIVSNFITELIEESLAKQATAIVFSSGMPAQLLLNGRLIQFGHVIDMEELEEDLEALGVAAGITNISFYFHPVDDYIGRMIQVFVKVRRGGELHAVKMSILEESSSPGLEKVQ